MTDANTSLLQAKAIDMLIDKSDQHLLLVTSNLVNDIALPGAREAIAATNDGARDLANSIRATVEFKGNNIKVSFGSGAETDPKNQLPQAMSISAAAVQQVLGTLGIELQINNGSTELEFKKADLAQVLAATMEVDGQVSAPDERRYRISHAIGEQAKVVGVHTAQVVADGKGTGAAMVKAG
jgi:hypothetical protein